MMQQNPQLDDAEDSDSSCTCVQESPETRIKEKSLDSPEKNLENLSSIFEPLKKANPTLETDRPQARQKKRIIPDHKYEKCLNPRPEFPNLLTSIPPNEIPSSSCTFRTFEPVLMKRPNPNSSSISSYSSTSLESINRPENAENFSRKQDTMEEKMSFKHLESEKLPEIEEYHQPYLRHYYHRHSNKILNHNQNSPRVPERDQYQKNQYEVFPDNPENSGSSGIYGNGKYVVNNHYHRLHRNLGENYVHGSSSNVNTSPSLIVQHRRDSSSSSSMVNNHHVSSRESSSSNARVNSRVEHFQENLQSARYHHHHGQKELEGRPVQVSNNSPPLQISSHHGHDHGNKQNPSTKISCYIGINGMQVSIPSKSKCQCHALQEDCRNKRAAECGSDGNSEMVSIMHQPPALPPRPPPRPARHYEPSTRDTGNTVEETCYKKYVILCCLCGGLNATIGSLFLAIHVVLSSHTASLALFETVSSYIPGLMLITMGFFIMLLARRKNRNGLLMKVCGSVGVVCALVCVLVTVTTTVIHLSRLQSLRECTFTFRAKSCTCYEAPQSPGVLFEAVESCESVHGVLYACLRALFGNSVAGILACIFSCMLVYQLLTHEKKKMYWEQLELRYRSLYGQGTAPGVRNAAVGSCGCCNDCGAAPNSWWAQTPGNLYTPNPDLAPSRRWRLPWSRSRGPAPSSDSNYGFHAQSRQVENNVDNTIGPYSVLSSQAGGPYSVLSGQASAYNPNGATYSVLETPVRIWGPPPPYSDPNSPARRPHIPEVRPRLNKRIENFDNAEDYRSRVTNKRPSDNYENAENLSNSTDPEGGNEGAAKNRRIRKPLKGVENCAFQQDSNSGPKQSESELYFGDVSSCCGPESSFYDIGLDKEAEHLEGMEYLAVHLGKRQLSKRSRLPLPLPTEPKDNEEETGDLGGVPYLAPDAQYEVIQQDRYPYNCEDEKHEENAEEEREHQRRSGRRRRRDSAEEDQKSEQAALSDSERVSEKENHTFSGQKFYYKMEGREQSKYCEPETSCCSNDGFGANSEQKNGSDDGSLPVNV